MSHSETGAPPAPPLAGASRQIMVIYGTRPEAVKVAPLIQALDRSMLDQVNGVFDVKPAFDLDIHRPGQTLTEITTRALSGVRSVLAQQRPDAVVVQGDTTTVFAAALAAFYEQIPVVHLEAGLRTGDPYSPYPEEINRRLTTRLATLHLAPTSTSKANLLTENVDEASIVVTGNTVIDALLWAVPRQRGYGEPGLAHLDAHDGPVLLVTAHRRESWGDPLRAVGRALARIAAAHRDLRIVFPVHRNPVVRDAVLPALHELPNVIVTEPLPYGSFCRLMNRATVILTDSGGVQEEGTGRHGQAGRHRRGRHRRHGRPPAHRSRRLRRDGQRRQPLRRRAGRAARSRGARAPFPSRPRPRRVRQPGRRSGRQPARAGPPALRRGDSGHDLTIGRFGSS